MKTNELISILRDYSNPNVLDYIDDAADALESQQKRIEELEAERHWIPVTERLPEHSDGHVLVTDGEQVKISCRNACYKTASGELRCAQGYGSGMPVTHWMPMPEPPKEGA